jgi:hypothetical protein
MLLCFVPFIPPPSCFLNIALEGWMSCQETLEASNSLEIYGEAERMLKRFVLLVDWSGSWCFFHDIYRAFKNKMIQKDTISGKVFLVEAFVYF